jgi:hypothetical protein
MTTTEAPIFSSVQQALHFSFLMETLPVTQKSSMQTMIDRMLEEMGIVQEREIVTINFGGLSAIEIRGQCAMVRGVVIHHLPQPEADAIHARYASQTLKASGVRGVRDYSQPLLSTSGDLPTLAMAWSLFATVKQRDGLSTQKIADEFGLGKSTVAKDVLSIRRTARMLENRAIERLTPLFERSGLMGDSE